MTTANKAPAPAIHRITPDDPPQFPCWVWSMSLGGKWVYEKTSRAEFDTHWHPDAPTAPTVTPTAPAPAPTR